MSASQIARMSCGELGRFLLARQLEQLVGFGLLQKWEVHRYRQLANEAYELTAAWRALVDGVVSLDRRGIIQFQKATSDPHVRVRNES
jgi:hypothetical protein